MKIPPSGDNLRPIGPQQPGQTGPTERTGFDAKIDAAKGAQGAQGAQGPEATQGAKPSDGPQTAELRRMLEGVDPKSPEAVGVAAEKLIDWHLTEQFGPAVLNARGIDDVRAKVREQILGDPVAEAKLRGILNRM